MKATQSGRTSAKSMAIANTPKGVADTSAIDALVAGDEVQAGPDQLAQIMAAAEELRQVTRAAIAAEAEYDRLKDEMRRIAETVLPSLMDSAGVLKLSLDDGTELIRGDEVYASISEANAVAAGDWMVANGFGALVKTIIALPFEKGDVKGIEKAKKILQKYSLIFALKTSIHAQTLKAFVKESIEEGRKLPESITYHQQPTAKLKAPKAAKKR